MKPLAKPTKRLREDPTFGRGGGPAPKRARRQKPIARYFDPNRERQTSTSGHPPPPPPPEVEKQPKTLFVDGINQLVSEEILYQLFINAGPIESVLIHHNYNDKPFAFVRFEHDESVLYSISLFRDVKLFGQKIRIQEAIAKDASTRRKPPPEKFPPDKSSKIRQAVSPSSAIAELKAELMNQVTSKQPDSSHLGQDFQKQMEENLTRLRQNTSRMDRYDGNRANLHSMQTDSGRWDHPSLGRSHSHRSLSPIGATPSAFTQNIQDFQAKNRFQPQNIFQQEQQRTGFNPLLQFGNLNQFPGNLNQLFPALANQIQSLNQDMFGNQQQQFMQYPGNSSEQQNVNWNRETANQAGPSSNPSESFPMPSPWNANSFDPRVDFLWGNPSQTAQSNSFANDYFGPRDQFQSTEGRRINFEPEPTQTLVRDQTMVSSDLARNMSSNSWDPDPSNSRIVRIGVKDRLGGKFQQPAPRLRDVSDYQMNPMRRNPAAGFFDNIPDCNYPNPELRPEYLDSLRDFSESVRDQSERANRNHPHHRQNYPGANLKKRDNRKWKNNR